MAWFGIQILFFLVHLVCSVIFRQHIQFRLGQGKVGPGVSYAKAHSVILQEAIYAPSVAGGTWAPEDHPITQLMMIRPVNFYDTFALDTGVLREIYPTRLLCRESLLESHIVPLICMLRLWLDRHYRPVIGCVFITCLPDQNQADYKDSISVYQYQYCISVYQYQLDGKNSLSALSHHFIWSANVKTMQRQWKDIVQTLSLHCNYIVKTM